MISRICLICSKRFSFYPYERKKRKYCAYKCYWQARKGIRISPKSEFKKGIKVWNKGLKGWNAGDKNPNWKEKVTYTWLHTWLSKTFKKTGICELCKEVRKTAWAKIKDLKYEKKRENFMELCYRCHYHYDELGEKRRRFN